MNKYKTPAGNTYSEDELRAKYGDQFDSLVADGTLVLVSSDEKKNSNETSDSDLEVEVTESTTETEEQPGSSDSLNPIIANKNSLFTTPVGNTYKQEELLEKYGNDFYNLVNDGTLTLSENQPEENVLVEEEDTFDPNSEEVQNQLLVGNKNLELLNSVGYIEANQANNIMNIAEDLDLLADLPPWQQEMYANKEKSYVVKDENGKNVFKKASELPEEVVEAIEFYEKSDRAGNVSLLEKTGFGYTNSKRAKTQLTEDEKQNEGGIDDTILQGANVNKEDYLKWKKNNTRKDSAGYKFFKTLISSDDSNEYESQKQQYERVQGYKASLLNDITADLSKIDSSLSFVTDPNEIKELKSQRKGLEESFLNTAIEMQGVADLFPEYKKYEVDRDLEARRELFNAARKGGGEEASVGLKIIGKTVGSTISNFAMDILASVPEFFDQRLFNLGYDKKGVLKGLSEMLSDSADHMDIGGMAPASRRTFIQGKPVLYKGDEYFVNKNGQVFDGKTNLLVNDILNPKEVSDIIVRSKDVTEEVTNWTAGSVLQGGTQTIANLIALIRSGGKTTKALGLKGPKAGAFGMGIASYASSLTGSVEDVRSQLVASGMPEDEATEIAINAGNAIASLDGIFSGLAGSNTKLLTGLQGVKQEIINLATTKGKKFTAKQLKKKGFELVKENAKELGIEELPVLLSEKGINYLVNQSIGREVLNQSVTKADILETAVLTIGATSTLGGRKLLSGNRRADFVRVIGKDIDNLQGTLNELVVNKELTKDQAYNAYNEIYNMQAGELKTKGTILMSKNVEEAADLLTQREKLTQQKEGLEGPLKEDVDKRITDVDEQIKSLKQRDVTEAQAIIDKENNVESKTEQDAIQEQETGDISNDQQSETTSEVESEVRLTPEQEAQTEIDSITETEQPSPEIEQEEVMSVNTDRVNSIVDGIIEKTQGRGKRRGDKDNRVAEQKNALSYLEGSQVFNEQMNDSEREAVVQDLNKKLGLEIPSPTKRQIDAKKKKDKKFVTVDESAALKDQIKLEAKAARDAKKDQTTRRKALYESIKNVRKMGNISLNKAKQLIKQVSTVNLNNAKKVQEVIDYVEKAANNAEYEAKVKKAKAIQKAIKKSAKGKEATLSDAALQFAKVNPSNVTDIDSYLENAQSVKDGLQKTKKTKGGLKVTKPFDVAKIDQYSKTEIENEAKKNFQLAKESFQDLTGTEPGDLTLEQIKEVLNTYETTPEKKADFEKENADVIDKAVNNAFNNTKINIKGSIESGDLQLDGEKKSLIRDFLNMDLSVFNTSQKMAILDAIVNFEMNQSTGGMQSMLSQYRGNKGMQTLKKDGIKSIEKSTWLGRTWNKYIATLPNVFDLMFKSQAKANKVMKEMGFTDLVNGSNKANKQASVVEKDYAKAFDKKKMREGKYFDEKNDIERGVLAEVRRVAPGTEAEQQAEFETSKSLIKETYERLLNSKDSANQKKGEVIKEVYDKILADAETINDVESKVDPANLEGVNYITEVWANEYEALADTSLNVYNRNLGKDINYTPRSVQKLQAEDKPIDITEPAFNPDMQQRGVYDKETGVIKPTTKPKTLPKGRVLNLGFDRQNLTNYKAAMTDVYTAPSIQQIQGARDSDAYNDVLQNENSREVIQDRINNYVASIRGVSQFEKEQKENTKLVRAMDKLATFGVVKALGGLTQPFKQMVPIFNTAVNTGIVNTLKGVQLVTQKEVNEAINNSGMPISNRGVQSQSDIESVDSKIDNTTRSVGGKIVKALDSANKKVLDATLVKPDVGTARASFIAYYIEAEGKKGVPSNEIDWTKPLNQESLNFAQQQVDRQQNTSDQNLQGGLFTSQNLTTQFIRKTAFPFANFLLNQKTRMYADINTLINNPTALPGDKKRAAKSLAGLGIETAAFNALGLGISSMLANLTKSIVGEDEDDKRPQWEKDMKDREEGDKRIRNQVRGRLGNVLNDVINPLPVTNDQVLNSANSLLGLFQDGEKDGDAFKFFAKTDKGMLEQLGVLGIGATKAKQLVEMIKISQTGEFKNYYGSTTKLSKSAQEKVGNTAIIYALHLVGAIPFSEVGYMSERALRDIKKMKEAKPERFEEEKDTRKTLEDVGKSKKSKIIKSNKLGKGKL
jgi:hypothetical protein